MRDCALDSLLQVDCVGQVIVVDDRSSDGTAELLDAVDNCRVQVIHHAMRAGKGAAIRTGLAHVACELVVIQDAV